VTDSKTNFIWSSSGDDLRGVQKRVYMLNHFKTAWQVLVRGAAREKPPPPVYERGPQFIRKPEAPASLPEKLLSGKNVLITGAGKNIGRSTALEMAAQGANVYYTDIEETALRKLDHELAGFQVSSRGFLSDISAVAGSDELYAFLERNGIAIDMLVNNVGIQHEDATGIKKLDLEEWHKTFHTNVFGPLYLTKLIAQMMTNNDTAGSILFITSIHDTVIRRIPSYSATKAALGMVVKELAMELAPHGIRVNGIAPGWVFEDEKGNTAACVHVPLHKSSINPAYIGRAAVYLSSDYFSKFTTGSTIKIDGGATLHNHLSVLEAFSRSSEAC
jgi:NAD(P)-dependent dehydrogenase (short-subunit alcohol dehydrogenase family)